LQEGLVEDDVPLDRTRSEMREFPESRVSHVTLAERGGWDEKEGEIAVKSRAGRSC